MTRREEGAYRQYSTDEERRQTDWTAAKNVKLFLTGSVGNGTVGDDEELLSGPNEAELAPS